MNKTHQPPSAPQARIRQSPHSRALELLGEKLAEAALSEGRLITWLKEVQAVPGGIFALRSIPARKLEILLEEWETVLCQLL